jgi:hypothetical protein
MVMIHAKKNFAIVPLRLRKVVEARHMVPLDHDFMQMPHTCLLYTAAMCGGLGGNAAGDGTAVGIALTQGIAQKQSIPCSELAALLVKALLSLTQTDISGAIQPSSIALSADAV